MSAIRFKGWLVWIFLSGLFLSSGFFPTYQDLSHFKIVNNTLTFRITKIYFFRWYELFDLVKNVTLNSNSFTSITKECNFKWFFLIELFINATIQVNFGTEKNASCGVSWLANTSIRAEMRRGLRIILIVMIQILNSNEIYFTRFIATVWL